MISVKGSTVEQDEIIKLAMEYGFTGGFDAEGNLTFDATFVEAVAEAVAKTRKATLEEMIYEHPTIAIKKAVEYAVKAEREQIIAITETQEFSRMYGEFTPSAYDLVKAIRARGEA